MVRKLFAVLLSAASVACGGEGGRQEASGPLSPPPPPDVQGTYLGRWRLELLAADGATVDSAAVCAGQIEILVQNGSRVDGTISADRACITGIAAGGSRIAEHWLIDPSAIVFAGSVGASGSVESFLEFRASALRLLSAIPEGFERLAFDGTR
jgi:hypothetical protein